MDYTELVESVGQITKRPERVQQIQLAVAKATLKCHLADFWMRDVVEVKGNWSEIVGNRFMINTTALLPGFRKIEYLNGYDDVTDPSNPRVMQQFEETDPSMIRDQYGYIQTNKYYFAGEMITCWSEANFPSNGLPQLSWQTGQPPRFLVGYYKLPVVTPSEFKSWIAEMIPFAIIDEACVEIFGSIGDADEAARRKKMFREENLPIIRTNDILVGVSR